MPVSATMSLARTIRHIRTAGLRKFWRDLQYIGDAKAGRLVGVDSLGNKFYEDLDEMPGRHRWVDYKEHDFNAPQVEPIWHSWLNHIRQDPPNIDPIVEASRKTWEIEHRDSVTGTRASFRTYSTVRPKIVSMRAGQCGNKRLSERKKNSWEPTVAPRK